jgi:protein-S-isoprenylcysteine O-methyltransferase Ste14
MNSLPTFWILVYAWIGIAVLSFFTLLRVRAPYGRYSTRRWGPALPHRWGWIMMELASPAVFLFFFLTGAVPKTAPLWVFAGLWTGHYLNRAVAYPLRQTPGNRMPILIMVFGLVFNGVNGFLNGHYLGGLASPYPLGWLADPRFLLGVFMFAIGAIVNWRADAVLLALRRSGDRDAGYRIPEGGLYRWVSCPNYLGEIVEWMGFAVLTWSLPAASFAIWTAANLIPRALSHHRWYREQFPDYPSERQALIPGLL